MPFLINESTRFISPAKTLEYMAGEKPVVSTPVHEVVPLYSGLVAVARGGTGFVAACQSVLDESARAHCQRAEAMLNAVFSRSWDSTVTAVDRLLKKARQRTDRALKQHQPFTATRSHSGVGLRPRP